jgi:hypothetical protein
MEVDLMRNRHWSAPGAPKGRFLLIAVPLVITMAVGLVIGIRLVSERNASLRLSAQGAAPASGTPAATASAPASPATTARASPTVPATATTTPAAAAANVSCVLIVPANPLTALGLATPFQLTGPGGMSPQASGCTMANFANLGAFAQATIFDPVTGALSTYEPLVITQGTQPAAAPVVPTLPAGAVVTVDVGFNGTNLTLQGATGTTLGQARCVNGIQGSIFGQVSFCNGVAFFAAVNRSIANGSTTIPANGTSAKTGQPCPTTRSFTMIDQDQSDNVTTQYLLNGNGQTAQDNAANTAAMPSATAINNGSDNALLDGFLDPTLGCAPFTAPDLSNGGTAGTSQALDELFAARDQTEPIALVPENDPMTLVNGAFSQRKTNRYRTSVDQPVIRAAQAAGTPAAYCQNMVNVQGLFLKNNQTVLATGTSPVPAVGNNLFTFMASRLNMSFTNLNCHSFGLTSPVTVTLGGNGVATAATINATQQVAASMTGPAAASQAALAKPKRGQNPARM